MRPPSRRAGALLRLGCHGDAHRSPFSHAVRNYERARSSIVFAFRDEVKALAVVCPEMRLFGYGDEKDRARPIERRSRGDPPRGARRARVVGPAARGAVGHSAHAHARHPGGRAPLECGRIDRILRRTGVDGLACGAAGGGAERTRGGARRRGGDARLTRRLRGGGIRQIGRGHGYAPAASPRDGDPYEPAD